VIVIFPCPLAPRIPREISPLATGRNLAGQAMAGKIVEDSGFILPLRGAIAQLGERIVRNDEVVGSIPTSSTKISFLKTQVFAAQARSPYLHRTSPPRTLIQAEKGFVRALRVYPPLPALSAARSPLPALPLPQADRAEIFGQRGQMELSRLSCRIFPCRLTGRPGLTA
jgi:hypothetical protein